MRPEGLDDLRATKLRIGKERWVVLSVPVPSGARVELSEAERAVKAMLLRGDSNADIARARGTSVRTVANQVASIFRKLGVRSRAELATREALAASGGTNGKRA